MADMKPEFFKPNNLDSIGPASAPDPSKGKGPDPKGSGPRPNTTGKSDSDVAGSSPNKPAPKFM